MCTASHVLCRSSQMWFNEVLKAEVSKLRSTSRLVPHLEAPAGKTHSGIVQRTQHLTSC